MSTPAPWTADQIPDLSGRRAVVTGANSGIGLQTAIQLAVHGAYVTLACRSEERGRAATETVRTAVTSGPGTAHLALLDLADLGSVRRFAESWDGPLDVLVNNAGVMAVPRATTVDGFERQLGTNHLGPFALTGGLLPALRQAPAGRVVTVSSVAHTGGVIDFEDLQSVLSYRRWAAYGQSKLANLLFTRELVRRLNRAGSTVTAAASHPGFSDTELIAGMTGGSGLADTISKRFIGLVGQPAAGGALPSLYAATMPDVVPGDYFGPAGFGGWRGAPVRVGMSARARDAVTGERLWQVSEDLTGVTYDLPG